MVRNCLLFNAPYIFYNMFTHIQYPCSAPRQRVGVWQTGVMVAAAHRPTALNQPPHWFAAAALSGPRGLRLPGGWQPCVLRQVAEHLQVDSAALAPARQRPIQAMQRLHVISRLHARCEESFPSTRSSYTVDARITCVDRVVLLTAVQPGCCSTQEKCSVSRCSDTFPSFQHQYTMITRNHTTKQVVTALLPAAGLC
jgi:hypothetical protein